MLTAWERLYLASEPALPVLQGRVRRDLRRLVGQLPAPVRLLDVGGRKSPYTVGVPAEVTVLDRPRVDQTQHELHLGVTDDELAHLRSRRSNIREVVLGDFLTAPLEEQSFDVVVAVEVIEHVVEDSAFVERLAAVLRPGGIAYLTTPNGDYVRNEGPHFNPDHLRHYRLDQLQGLLERSFHRVIVTYGVKTGRFRYHGLFGDLSPRRPLASLVTASNNVVSRLESRDLQFQPSRTAHLFAVAWREDGR